MDTKQINQNLKQLETQAYNCLQSISKYSYDQEITEDDYSKEYLYFELFYAISNYERAINTLKLNKTLKQRFDAIYQLALETLQLEEKNYFSRLNNFGEQYFSDVRYTNQINLFKEGINYNSLEEIPDDEKTLIENGAHALFKIRDEIYLLNQNNSLFVNYFSSTEKLDHYKAFEEKISVIHKENRWFWSVFNEIIENYRLDLLVPATNTWWYDLAELSVESFELAIAANISLQQEKTTVAETLRKLMAGEFEKLKESTNNTIDWIIDHHKESFSHLSNLTQSPSLAFQTWSEGMDEPAKSDHAIKKDIFVSVPGVNNEIIEDLINLVQFTDDINEEEKKHIIATAYLIIGKRKEALDLLDDEKK